MVKVGSLPVLEFPFAGKVANQELSAGRTGYDVTTRSTMIG